jgi:hypothetical protein
MAQLRRGALLTIAVVAWTAAPAQAQFVMTPVGLQSDLRYVRAFVDENKREGVVFRDYGFLRVSFGVTFGFPAH